MRTETKLKIYEIDGEELTFARTDYLGVVTAKRHRCCVDVTVEGKTYTVEAESVKKAVDNAVNVTR